IFLFHRDPREFEPLRLDLFVQLGLLGLELRELVASRLPFLLGAGLVLRHPLFLLSDLRPRSGERILHLPSRIRLCPRDKFIGRSFPRWRPGDTWALEPASKLFFCAASATATAWTDTRRRSRTVRRGGSGTRSRSTQTGLHGPRTSSGNRSRAPRKFDSN